MADENATDPRLDEILERVRIRRDRERRRAARALDRYIDTIFPGHGSNPGEATLVASERFVEAVGDYVLSGLQQKSDYDATPGGFVCDGERRGICSGGPAHHPECDSAPDDNPCAGGRCVDPWAHAEGAHDL